MEHQYFRIRKDRQDYKGQRYFKFDPMSEKVVQICVSSGEEKKGRTNSFGVYLIHRLTFFANYLALKYAEPCEKEEYEEEFERIVKMLR
jgi:hypothetical protein